MSERPIMDRRPIPADRAKAIWNVLCEECGCRDTADRVFEFVAYLGRETPHGHEFRFMGALGFGGKFYNTHDSWRVGCYGEHRTPEREAMIQRANERLRMMRAEYLANPEPTPER